MKSIDRLIDIFSRKYPEPTTELNFTTPFELLVATILSAQTTDKQVNKVTANLFNKYNTPADFMRLSRKELEGEVKSIGLFRNKSKYIIEASRIIMEKYQGQVPMTREELMKLPGVGRKTANVVLACAFNQPAIAVDTHVFRVANRLGLTEADNVRATEDQLMDHIPDDKWVDMHHWLIYHGRETCKAQNPDCSSCLVNQFCKYFRERE